MPTKNRRVPPCAVKTCAVRPFFARMVGELRAADPSNVQGPVEQNASSGEQSEAPRPIWRSRSRTQDQKTRTGSTCWSNPGGIWLKKGLTKRKHRANNTKEFPEQFEGITGSLPSKTSALRQIAPESSPERSAKSLSHSFLYLLELR